MQKVSFLDNPSLDDYYASDGDARNYAADMIKL
jgi:1-deoxy-D-xylulose-5-phosphate reductoisomerase